MDIQQQQVTTWEQYVLTLPIWEQQLIGEVHLTATEKLKETLKAQAPLYMCSDGGAVHVIGSYRFSNSITDGNPNRNDGPSIWKNAKII